MEIEKIQQRLVQMTRMTEEPVREDLAEDIKRHIPNKLNHHRKGIDGINIIIDLRISKLAAAVIIIATLIVSASLFNTHDSSDGLIKEGKLLVRYLLGKSDTKETSEYYLDYYYDYYNELLKEGKEVVYYGENATPADPNSIIIHWKISEDTYNVVFGNLQMKTLNSEELIQIQAEMLQKR